MTGFRSQFMATRWTTRRRTTLPPPPATADRNASKKEVPYSRLSLRTIGPALLLLVAFVLIHYCARWEAAGPTSSSSSLVGLVLPTEPTTTSNRPLSGAPHQLVQLRQVPREVTFFHGPAFPDYHPASPVQSIDPSHVVAHAVSLIRCPTDGDATQQFVDALVTLRHGIHLNSAHNVASSSTYGYRMYAFVHANHCATPHPGLPGLLTRLGYTVRVVSNPVIIENEVPDGFYKNRVESENCCGSDEFIKLYAYALTEHKIVVHWDLDTLVLQPMDDLYDAMLHPSTSPIGRSARNRIRIQRPNHQQVPEVIDAFFTRDVTSSAPWEPVQGVQGGFLVARPNVTALEAVKALIRSGDYTRGRGPGSGWGGMGYGGFQGAMAYQGVLAFYYDVLHPNRHVELDVCRWNQVAADVIWRGPGKDELGNDHMHECRDFPRYTHNVTTNTLERGGCEDCRITPIEETMTVHYTACLKPFQCRTWEPPRRRNKDHQYRLSQIANATTCSVLMRRYFQARRHVESLIAAASGTKAKVFRGTYHPEAFLGYCSSAGGYQPMEPLPVGFDMKQVYGF